MKLKIEVFDRLTNFIMDNHYNDELSCERAVETLNEYICTKLDAIVPCCHKVVFCKQGLYKIDED